MFLFRHGVANEGDCREHCQEHGITNGKDCRQKLSVVMKKIKNQNN